jgi:broad specificity phosphatase PhoE
MKFIIILGSVLNQDYTPGSHLLSRLEEAIILYKKDDKVVVTGFRQEGFNRSQADVMKEWLFSKRIDAIKEERSTNTIESAVFVKEILKKYYVPNICVVTSEFHIPRASLIFLDIMPEYRLSFHASKSKTWDDIRIVEPRKITYTINKIPLKKNIKLTAIDIVRRGYLEGLKGKDLSVIDDQGMSVLHWSVNLGFTDITRYLLKEGVDKNRQVDGTGLTPLHCAIIKFQLDDIWELLCNKVTMNIPAIDYRWSGKKTGLDLIMSICPRYSTIIQLMMYKWDKNCIFLLRHAQSMDNVEEYKDIDTPLSNLGIDDATFIGKYICKYNLLKDYTIITSPLLRTLETTRLLIGNSLDVNVDNRITERLTHISSIGRELNVLIQLYPWKFNFTDNIWWWNNNEYEPKKVFIERITNFLDDLKLNKALIITHGGVMSEIFKNDIIENCSMFRFDF